MQFQVLEPEPVAGAPPPGLDLVGDQQDAVTLGQRAQKARGGRRHRKVAALALLRFEEDGGDVAADVFQKPLQIRKARRVARGGHVVDARAQRPEEAVVGVPVQTFGARQGGWRTACGRGTRPERDKLGAARRLQGQLRRRVDRFAAAVLQQQGPRRAGEHARTGRPSSAQSRPACRRGAWCRDVRDPRRLLGDGRQDLRVVVAAGVDRDAACEIDVARAPVGEDRGPCADSFTSSVSNPTTSARNPRRTNSSTCSSVSMISSPFRPHPLSQFWERERIQACVSIWARDQPPRLRRFSTYSDFTWCSSPSPSSPPRGRCWSA